ncbi:sulfuric ester hydrolase [Aureococcus anophagefferens]|nr:sulfuric ester hydrolase [Aureococcus anophagefferens]
MGLIPSHDEHAPSGSSSCQKSDWREGHKKVCKARREGHKKEAATAAPAFGHYIQTPEDKCSLKIRGKPCPLCRKPWPKTHAMMLAYLRKNVDSGVPEAMNQLGDFYRFGRVDASGRKNPNKAANCVEINQ